VYLFNIVRVPSVAVNNEDADLESLLFSQNKRLWEPIDRSILSGKKEGLPKFQDVPD